MRILVVHPGPPLSQHDVWRGYDKALRKAGHQVYTYRTDKFLLTYRQWPPTANAVQRAQQEIFSFALEIRPDLVFLVGTSFIGEPLLADLESRGFPVVALFTESPYEDERQLPLAELVTASLINDPVNMAAYERTGNPVLYVPPSYDPEIHYPGLGIPKDIDFTFIGSALPARIAFFSQMALDGLEVCIDGGGWFAPNGIGNTDTANLYRRTKVGINVYREGGGWSVGPRELEMAACGLFFLRDKRAQGDELFSMLPAFESPEEASALLRFWLKRDSERAKLACEAFRVIKDFTFDRQTARILKFLGIS